MTHTLTVVDSGIIIQDITLVYANTYINTPDPAPNNNMVIIGVVIGHVFATIATLSRTGLALLGLMLLLMGSAGIRRRS